MAPAPAIANPYEFYMPARAAQELEEKGNPINDQAMDLTGDAIKSVTVQITDSAGKPIGNGFLVTFYGVWDGTKKSSSDISFVLTVSRFLAQASEVKLSFDMTHYQVASITVRLVKNGSAQNVFSGVADHATLVAIRMPTTFEGRESGESLKLLLKQGASIPNDPASKVWFADSGSEAKTGAGKSSGVRSANLSVYGTPNDEKRNGLKYAVNAPYRPTIAGTPVFRVQKELQYTNAGGQLWLHSFLTNVVGLLDSESNVKGVNMTTLIPRAEIVAMEELLAQRLLESRLEIHE